MKHFAVYFLLFTATLISARGVQEQDAHQVILSNLVDTEPLFQLEFTDGSTQLVTEEEKWQLKKGGFFFMDITSHPTIPHHQKSQSKFPSTVSHKHEITPLLTRFKKTNLKTNLKALTKFHNRWYKSPHGLASYNFLYSLIQSTIASTGADKHGIKAEPFEHPWGQNSIVVKIPGKGDGVVVVGAHQDSVNHADPMNGRAPGADDDGSGTVTILEVLRVLLGDEGLVSGEGENEVQFHWYAGEEAGLKGSLALFADYAAKDVDVKAMLQQDMTGFYNATIEKEKEFGLMMDEGTFDGPLMEYLKLIIKEYTALPYIETGCGVRCGSDHMSALKVGYPAAYVIEGKFELSDKHLHGEDDLIEYLDFDHMVDHAQMTLAFLYELAFAEL